MSRDKAQQQQPLARVEPLAVTDPGIFRFLLDRYARPLHNALTRYGTLARPPELDDLNLYLRNLHSDIEHEIRNKTYIPVTGREIPQSTLPEDESKDPFVKPIHQVIRQLVGIAHGGDSASAQIAAVNRKSRTVRNILAALLRADEPLILLGDPGTGKTMTLKQTAMALAESESRRVFPVITIYVRLGEFRVEGDVGPEEVAEYVRRSVPKNIRPYFDDLDRAGQRLVILFDGMDEMSRERYTEHTEALSRFAGERKGVTKTLFSCRITDFSPKFIHQRLVLLPFNRAQIAEYLGKYIDSFPLDIDGEKWTLKQLARRLAAGGLPMEANNPFVLWLLCIYLQEKKTWPSSRVDLLGFFNRLNYRRKAEEVRKDEPAFPDSEDAFAGWGLFAYTITTLNRGAAVKLTDLKSSDPKANGHVEELIRVGQRCGVLVEATDGAEHLVRFEHHRFQEYFTALHIQQARPQMSWLDKLDAPRWQETMLNLILMGGADDAVQALAVAMVEPIRRPDLSLTREGEDDAPDGAASEDPAQFTEEHETATADRVELASRVLRQVGSGASAVRAALLPPFNEAVNFLSDKGNPITQVKMLRACQNVPDLDFIEVLKKSLKSPINWVRNQALVVMASSDRGTRAVGSNFATEMAFDLANGLFPERIPAYVKAALTSSSKRSWWCLASGILCYLVNLLLLLGVGALIYWGAALASSRFGLASWFANPMCVVAYASVVLLAAALALKFAPNLMWAAILASAAGSVSLFALIMVGWNMSLSKLFGIIGVLYIGVIVGYSLSGVIGFALQALSLILFCVLNPQVKGSGYSVGTFLRTAWRGGGFNESLDFVREQVSEVGVGILFSVGLVLLYFLFTYALQPLSVWLNQIIGLHFHPLVTLGLAVATAAIVGTLVLSLVTLKIKPYLKFWGLVLGTIVGVGLVIGAISILGYVLTYLGDKLSRWFGAEAGAFIVRALLVLIMLTIIAALVFSLYLLCREIVKLLRFYMRPLSPSSMTPESWKKQLAESNSEEQHLLLLKTNYQSLGMKADEYLDFLKTVSTLITSEPALSTYWSQRAQLEQVLKQERVG